MPPAQGLRGPSEDGGLLGEASGRTQECSCLPIVQQMRAWAFGQSPSLKSAIWAWTASPVRSSPTSHAGLTSPPDDPVRKPRQVAGCFASGSTRTVRCLSVTGCTDLRVAASPPLEGRSSSSLTSCVRRSRSVLSLARFVSRAWARAYHAAARLMPIATQEMTKPAHSTLTLWSRTSLQRCPLGAGSLRAR